MDNLTQNILAVFEQATPEEVSHGVEWYALAHAQAQAIADRVELPLVVVVGVIAALSPTNQWDRNLVDAENLCTAFVQGYYPEDVMVCTYHKMKEKAWTILVDLTKDPTATHVDPEAVAEILRGPKITDFFYCILGDQSRCVIDGHAWCIANADRRTMQEVPNIGKRNRHAMQDAYAEAGRLAGGYAAYEMQAITWVAWRRIHNVA